MINPSEDFLILGRAVLYLFHTHKGYNFLFSILWRFFERIKIGVEKLPAFEVKIDSVAFVGTLCEDVRPARLCHLLSGNVSPPFWAAISCV